MDPDFDINRFRVDVRKSRYDRQLKKLADSKKYTKSIEHTIETAINNINEKCKSFVIYGEPQSGKTEMMISLTARLLDEDFKVIIILLNDSVQLLQQNLERFKRSGIDPAPKNFDEILDPSIKIGSSEYVIFCKKNSQDLQKLISKLGNIGNKIIIDDEADYATPNAKINKAEKTKINELVEVLVGQDGIYIGVTATPARLDLNNTLQNQNDRWVDFSPHPDYQGQDIFFPTSIDVNGDLKFNLNTMPDTGDDPKYLRDALFRFLVNVAHLNNSVNEKETNYSMLVHTSGIKADHTEDYKNVVKIFDVLKNENEKDFSSFYQSIWTIAKFRYPGEEDEITQYIMDYKNKHSIIVMNSNTDKKTVDYTSATNPSTLFTIVIGGNIVSRGVTFENLLSMFFTRDVKHKVQQDTYIQRARMFGTRGSYLPHFELSIPEHLYLDWHKCFVFHRLSLESIRAGKGSPTWLGDLRVSPVSPSSIDKTTVSMDSGEMSFEIFDYNQSIEKTVSENIDSFSKLRKIQSEIGLNAIPEYLITYISHFSPAGSDNLAVHHSKTSANSKDADQEKIQRARGFIGDFELEKNKFPQAMHHIKIIYNEKNKARLFYKFDGSIKFIKNQGKK